MRPRISVEELRKNYRRQMSAQPAIAPEEEIFDPNAKVRFGNVVIEQHGFSILHL